MVSIEIKKLNKSAILPVYQTKHSVGMDLSACIEKNITLKPLQRALVPCGIGISIPDGFEAQIRARSGLALNNGIALVNGVGTIDSDYRGEIGVILINLGSEVFTIKNGDRVAQMIINNYEKIEFKLVEELTTTERGNGAFGSTGK